jgi:hypothetical protein
VPQALARRSFVLAKYIYEWKPTQYGNRLFRRPGSGPAPVKVKAAKAASEPTPEPEPAPAYLSKADLVAAAEEQGLDTSGTRAELLERLEGGSDE